MRPMIRLGNLNARPSCPAAAPGSTVWVYLYAAGHRDMPGDSPTGNRRLSGTRAQDGEIADTLPMKTAAPVERVALFSLSRTSCHEGVTPPRVAGADCQNRVAACRACSVVISRAGRVPVPSSAGNNRRKSLFMSE